MDELNIPGRSKAAILLIALGPEIAAKIFRYLKDEEIEKLTLEIANHPKISEEEKDMVLNEFKQMMAARNYLFSGGIELANSILDKAIGRERAGNMLRKLTATLQVRPFDFARQADPAQLFNFIQNEHPQTIALVMAYLDPGKAGTILSQLPAERQFDVAKRLATMERTSPEVLHDVERILESKMSQLGPRDYTSAGGVEAIVEVLNRVDRATERSILENFEMYDPELAEEIKKRMFTFEDIVLLDDRSLQLVLREVDNKDLALSLKAAPVTVSEKIFRNISKRASEMLREEIEFMGPVRISDVEDSQQKIVNVIRRLEESGEIIVARGKGDEIIV
ncbi:MAG: flagellar motor switch protein FliG [Negativicutes bacterium]|nr:flagellar motor switch protein FliG [Negativicutes bacterium]